MPLRTTPVSTSLDKKLRLLGFEVLDVLAIFLVLSTLNFFFGQTNSKLVLIWLPSMSLALTLYVGKKGKPENHLIHWIRFQIRPGSISAFQNGKEVAPPPKLRRNT